MVGLSLGPRGWPCVCTLHHQGRSIEEARVMLSMTLWLLTFLVPLQIFLGDQHGLNTAAYQPAKLAAIEARWDTQPSFPLTLFAIPDPANETNRYAIEVPYLGSLILTHSLHGEIKGLKTFRPEDRPPVAIPFFAFRIMVGIGFLMLAVVATSWWLRYRHRLFDSPWFLRLCLAMGPLGFVAVLAGWTTTEVGRQPWTVYGMLRTVDSTPPSLTGGDVLASLMAYMAVYLIIYPSAAVIAARLVRNGPATAPESVAPIESGRPSAPVNVELLPEGKTL
ncbi:cytochrome ubiquinol oxidase subunit I [Rhodopila globiformis]|nr:cytochrome ubiquinol oxidase subunit I [Rhodopila globiformis]